MVIDDLTFDEVKTDVFCLKRRNWCVRWCCFFYYHVAPRFFTQIHPVILSKIGFGIVHGWQNLILLEFDFDGELNKKLICHDPVYEFNIVEITLNDEILY